MAPDTIGRISLQSIGLPKKVSWLQTLFMPEPATMIAYVQVPDCLWQLYYRKVPGDATYRPLLNRGADLMHMHPHCCPMTGELFCLEWNGKRGGTGALE